MEPHSLILLGVTGGVNEVKIVTSQVDIQLYVILNSEGALYSMHAWASDSDGDGYEVPVYYSAGVPDGPFYTLSPSSAS